jgi:two-component system sensor histidine kinase/response regulator
MGGDVILLVDDEQDILDSLGELLRHRGFTVMTAMSVRHARKILDYFEVDLIVADLELDSDESGQVLLDFAASRFPSTARLLYSSTPPVAETSDHKVVQKPDIEGLLKAVRAVEIARLSRRDRLSTDRSSPSFGATKQASVAPQPGEPSQLREELILLAQALKNPLGVIAANTEFMERHLTDLSEATAALADIRRAAKQALRLVSNVRELSRLESQRTAPVRVSTVISRLVRTAAEPRSRLAQQLQIDLRVGPLSHREFPLDVNLMQRVLENILDNALRYTPPRGRIELAALERQDRLVITIGNSGPAIPLAERERIFEKHDQLGVPLRHLYVGIGLYLCRLAVEAHGGTIRIESTPTLPTLFVIEVPAESPAAE